MRTSRVIAWGIAKFDLQNAKISIPFLYSEFATFEILPVQTFNYVNKHFHLRIPSTTKSAEGYVNNFYDFIARAARDQPLFPSLVQK